MLRFLHEPHTVKSENMCCIIYKPKGVRMPSPDILDRIQRINHHGYGFVSSRHRYKTMDYQKFLVHLSKVGTDEECIIHMRWATHGSKCRKNCHPFVENGVYFAHNGVLPIKSVNDMTDSEIFFRSQVYPLIDRYGYESEVTERLISAAAGSSRFAMMYRGKVKLYGDYTKLNGVYYSNLRWL